MNDLSQLVDDYIARTNSWQPAGATGRGFHEHDARLGERSERAIEGRMADVRGMLERAKGIDAAALQEHEPYELDLLCRRLQWELSEHESVRSWQRSPGGYLGTIGGACNGLVIRDFAPLDERLRSLTGRLRAAPELLAQAKTNLTTPSKYHVETAIEQAAGMRALFERDLPEAASKSSDNALKGEFEEANRAALAAVDDFAAWLKSDLLPRATETFAWGADTMRKLLSETDSIDEPMDSLIKRCEEDLRAHQQMLRDVAAKIDPSASPAEVVDAVSRDPPSATVGHEPAGIVTPRRASAV
jgi:uncharacterized protein (DUF885 family)